MMKGDALITNQKQIPLGVLTADCAPILLYDDNKKITITAHAYLLCVLLLTDDCLRRVQASETLRRILETQTFIARNRFLQDIIEDGVAVFLAKEPTQGHDGLEAAAHLLLERGVILERVGGDAEHRCLLVDHGLPEVLALGSVRAQLHQSFQREEIVQHGDIGAIGATGRDRIGEGLLDLIRVRGALRLLGGCAGVHGCGAHGGGGERVVGARFYL